MHEKVNEWQSGRSGFLALHLLSVSKSYAGEMAPSPKVHSRVSPLVLLGNQSFDSSTGRGRIL